MPVTNVVFDIGNVLVDWKPHLAWIEELGSRDAVESFIERTGFMALNARADAGERFADLAKEVADPEDRRRITDYVPHHSRTIMDGIEGTWGLIERLKARNVPIHAITNWAAETWPEGVKGQPRLATTFQTLIVSGVENIAKPDPQIFHLFCDRAGVAPSDCLFVDDKLENVEAAVSVGMQGAHFTTSESLETQLRDIGLL